MSKHELDEDVDFAIFAESRVYLNHPGYVVAGWLIVVVLFSICWYFS